MPSRTPRALTRDPERTRAAILAAATQEFTANGLTGARVDAIANRARVNKRMIYHYFGDKEGLYLAVLEATYAAIRAAELDLHLTDRDPVGRHARAGAVHLALFPRPPGIPQPARHREPAQGRVPQALEAHPRAAFAAGRHDLRRCSRAARRRACSAPASIRSSSTSPSRRSASSISPTGTRSRPSSGATSRRPKSIAAREKHIVDVVLNYLKV